MGKRVLDGGDAGMRSIGNRNTSTAIYYTGDTRFNPANGYFYIKQPEHPKANNSGWILLHVYLLEKKLGRYLTDEEEGHHKNEIRTDNSDENLEVINKREHQRLHCLKRDFPRASKYRWVRYNKTNRNWQARVTRDGIEYTAVCSTELEAAIKADEIALKLHGPSAKFNFPTGIEKYEVGTELANSLVATTG